MILLSTRCSYEREQPADARDRYEKKDEPQHDGPAFAPRAHQKKSQVQDKYKDRAEMRRQGVEDEYKPVEKLLEDLEKRAEKDEGYDVSGDHGDSHMPRLPQLVVLPLSAGGQPTLIRTT